MNSTIFITPTEKMFDLLRLCLLWYETHPCGGDLHIVLDDDNIDDDDIEYCYNNTDDENAIEILNKMKEIPVDERIWVTYNIYNTKLDENMNIIKDTTREVYKETEEQ